MQKQDGLVESVTSRYDRQARSYLDSLVPVLAAPGRRLLREFEGTRRKAILEVGTGVGTLLPHIQKTFSGSYVVGCDRSRGMLALTPPGTRVAAMDARKLAVASNSVDLYLSIFMLFFLDEPLDGLREARRVLRSGGLAGTVTWGSELESRALSIWNECLDEQDPSEPDPAAASSNDTVDTPEKMEALLQASGFASGRAWEEELTTTIELEHLIRMKTTVGRQKARFDGLAPPAREACVARARRGMATLDREGFVARAKVVYAVGCVA
jgi:SAM-dependent methyltransferase